nr:aminoglycoside phosphotransferase [Tanacetum cinerariifolium]
MTRSLISSVYAVKFHHIRMTLPWHLLKRNLDNRASLGQVYKSRLKENGDLVAVKVQWPFVLETVTVDLFIIRNLGLALKRFPQEPDYVNKGENGTYFAEMLKKDLPQVAIPKTYTKYTSKKVLTTQWVDGEKFSQSTESDGQ